MLKNLMIASCLLLVGCTQVATPIADANLPPVVNTPVVTATMIAHVVIPWVAIVLLALFAGYDFWRYYRGELTVSQLYWPLLPLWANMAIIVAIGVVVWWVFGGAPTFAPWAIGLVCGHLFWRSNK